MYSRRAQRGANSPYRLTGKDHLPFSENPDRAGAQAVFAQIFLLRAHGTRRQTYEADSQARIGHSVSCPCQAGAGTERGGLYMRSEDLLEAIGQVDDSLIEQITEKKNRPYKRNVT